MYEGNKMNRKMMKAGKLSYNALKRSVLRPLKKKRTEVVSGPRIGCGSAQIQLSGGKLAAATNTVSIDSPLAIPFLLHRVLNDLAACGACGIAVEAALTIPQYTPEPELAGWMKCLEKEAEACAVDVCGGHTMVSEDVLKPILSLTALGEQQYFLPQKPEAGMELIVTKQIGLEGTAFLATEREVELSERYTYEFILAAKQMAAEMSAKEEAEMAAEEGAAAMHNLSEGGILGALWEMADGAGLGLEVNMKDIPIRQETVEICEFFEVNPYQLISGGSMLIAGSDGHRISRRLQQAGIPASVIGRFTDKNDRILVNGDEIRYLDRPKQDELYRIREKLYKD